MGTASRVPFCNQRREGREWLGAWTPSCIEIEYNVRVLRTLLYGRDPRSRTYHLPVCMRNLDDALFDIGKPSLTVQAYYWQGL